MAVRLGDLSLPAIDRRAVVGIGLAALAATFVLLVTRPSPTHPVLVAGGDLIAGRPLGEMEVTVRHVTEPTGLVAGTDVGALADWTLAVTLRAGEPLLPSLLVAPQRVDAPDLFAVDVEATRAVLGRLAPGDLVDIYATTGALGSDPATRLVASEVYVVDAAVVTAAGGRDRVELLLAVDDALASALVAARNGSDLDVVRVGP